MSGGSKEKRLTRQRMKDKGIKYTEALRQIREEYAALKAKKKEDEQEQSG